MKRSYVSREMRVIKFFCFFPHPHLVLVEFQYTACLLAMAAEIICRKIVAFQTGRVAGVHAGEPILGGGSRRSCTAARRGWEWVIR